ncbi:hypothetical protein B0H13DRAFT_1910651 [Mycena leptocephala]|nr:hypothetical protein B0H13DRAFT_1910651 [Mycena leptocephala]
MSMTTSFIVCLGLSPPLQAWNSWDNLRAVSQVGCDIVSRLVVVILRGVALHPPGGISFGFLFLQMPSPSSIGLLSASYTVTIHRPLRLLPPAPDSSPHCALRLPHGTHALFALALAPAFVYLPCRLALPHMSCADLLIDPTYARALASCGRANPCLIPACGWTRKRGSARDARPRSRAQGARLAPSLSPLRLRRGAHAMERAQVALLLVREREQQRDAFAPRTQLRPLPPRTCASRPRTSCISSACRWGGDDEAHRRLDEDREARRQRWECRWRWRWPLRFGTLSFCPPAFAFALALALVPTFAHTLAPHLAPRPRDADVNLVRCGTRRLQAAPRWRSAGAGTGAARAHPPLPIALPPHGRSAQYAYALRRVGGHGCGRVHGRMERTMHASSHSRRSSCYRGVAVFYVDTEGAGSADLGILLCLDAHSRAAGGGNGEMRVRTWNAGLKNGSQVEVYNPLHWVWYWGSEWIQLASVETSQVQESVFDTASMTGSKRATVGGEKADDIATHAADSVTVKTSFRKTVAKCRLNGLIQSEVHWEHKCSKNICIQSRMHKSEKQAPSMYTNTCLDPEGTLYYNDLDSFTGDRVVKYKIYQVTVTEKHNNSTLLVHINFYHKRRILATPRNYRADMGSLAGTVTTADMDDHTCDTGKWQDLDICYATAMIRKYDDDTPITVAVKSLNNSTATIEDKSIEFFAREIGWSHRIQTKLGDGICANWNNDRVVFYHDDVWTTDFNFIPFEYSTKKKLGIEAADTVVFDKTVTWKFKDLTE